MVGYDFEIIGIEKFTRHLDRFERHSEDARPAFDNIARDFKLVEEKQFNSASGWAPLSPRYAAWKERHYPGRPILTRTGRLRASLRDGTDHVERMTAHQLEIGTRARPAQFHQYGTRRMPQRKVISPTKADINRWVRYIQRHLFEEGLLR